MESLNEIVRDLKRMAQTLDCVKDATEWEDTPEDIANIYRSVAWRIQLVINEWKKLDKASERLAKRGLRLDRALPVRSEFECKHIVKVWKSLHEQSRNAGETSLSEILHVLLTEMELTHARGNDAGTVRKAYEMMAILLQTIDKLKEEKQQ